MKAALPNSWQMVTLRNLLSKLESGSRPKGGVKNITEGIPSIGGEHLDSNGTFRFEKIKYVPEDFAERMTRGHIEKDDILIVKDGATTSKTSFVGDSFPFEQAVVNEHVFICRSSSYVDPKYLFYYLLSAEGKEQILKDFRGAAQGGISQKFADKVLVPVAPRDQQKKIVAEIEKQFSRLDEAVTSLKRAKANLKRYKATVLKAAVEGKLTEEWRKQHPGIEPASELLKRILAERRGKWEEAELSKMRTKGKKPKNDNWKKRYKEPPQVEGDNLPLIPSSWKWTKFEQLASQEPNALKAGPFGSSLKKAYYSPQGYKIYGQEQVLRNDPYFGDYYIDKKRFEKLQTCAVRPGDILISLVGTIGRVLILPSDIEPGIINPRLVKLSLDERVVLPEYISVFMQSPSVKQYFRIASHGGTMAILNLTILKQIPIPLPPVEEQAFIVQEIERMATVEHEIGKSPLINMMRAARLRQTVLNMAFSGEFIYPVNIQCT